MAQSTHAATPAQCTAGTTDRGSVRGTTPANIPASNAPAWQPEGCPSWCECGDLHRSGDHYDDRIHVNLGAHVALSIPRQVDDEIPTLDVSLIQHYREASPRVWIGRDGSSKGDHLTVDEAREGALRLLELVRMADEAENR